MSKRDGFFKSSSLLLVGMMVANVINYLFQLTMGRMLSISAYGEMNTLMSILLVLSFPVYSVTVFLTKRLSHNFALGRYNVIKGLIARTYRGVLVVGVVTFLAGSLFANRISGMLKIDGAIPIILLFLSIGVFVVVPINSAILQGIHRFRMLSFLAAASCVFKYVLCVGLVAVGMGLNGIMLGLMLSYVLTIYISDIPIRAELKSARWSISNNQEDASDVSLSFLIPVTAANLALAVFSQTDQILVKYFFSPTEAGMYSSAAIIGKAVMYVPAAIVTSLFPMVAYSRARAESTVGLIVKAFAITLVLSGGGAFIIYIVPDLIISLFFGAKFMPASNIVGLCAVAMLPMALVMVLINYNLARNKTLFAYIVLLCAIGQVVGIIVFHSELASVLRVILISGSLCVTALLTLMAVEYLRR
ncbi:MAG: oligosaccharide flippase family protein [Nitrospirae bacterium]|nr:oligosaccharide flippase family protein [Nitrospirota bacterium]